MVAKRATSTPAAAAVKVARDPTPFEARLHELCKCIPKGKVTTYGAMAQVLASAPRAVGQALRRNPFAPIVPCHRVVAADRTMGGFRGTWGEENPEVCCKKGMLLDEGVAFDDKKVASASVVAADDLALLLAKAAPALRTKQLGTAAAKAAPAAAAKASHAPAAKAQRAPAVKAADKRGSGRDSAV